MKNKTNTQYKILSEYPNYEIHSDGTIYSIKSKKFLKPSMSCKNGYKQLFLLDKNGVRKSQKVAQLVAKAFIGKSPKGYSINHINGIKTDNSVKNLEIIPHKENVQHAVKMGLIKIGDESPKAIYKNSNIKDALYYYNIGVHKKVVCEHFGITQQYFNRVLNGQLRKHLLTEVA